MKSMSTACTTPTPSIPQEIKPNNGGICKAQVLVGGSLVVPLGLSSGAQLFLETSAAILARGPCAFP